MSDPSCCPLCGSGNATRFFETRDKHGHREFDHCPECDIVFVPRRHHLDKPAQRERYLTHENDPDDEGYRNFLSRLLNALRPCLIPGSTGLDYGAGTGPALAIMMRQEGFGVRLYDPFFHPDESVLGEKYDFVTCTETAEHFVDPMRDFEKLNEMLKPSGWLGVMTGMLDSWDCFSDWYYHRDPTHICFYSKRTMEWIANHFSLEVRFPRQDVALFRKPA